MLLFSEPSDHLIGDHNLGRLAVVSVSVIVTAVSSLAVYFLVKIRCCSGSKTDSTQPQPICIRVLSRTEDLPSNTLPQSQQTVPSSLASHNNSGQHEHRTAVEMNVYREDCDSDWEERRIEAIRNLRIQDYSAITPSSSESEYENPSMIYGLPMADEETRIHCDYHVEPNSSDSEFEDPRWFQNFPDYPVEPTARDDFQVFETNSSDSEFEDPRLFDIVRESPTGATTLDDSQRTEVYDPNFEDPRLFGLISDVSPSEEPPNEDSSSTGAASVEKHMWPCVVCVEKTPETLFTPCFHSVCCQECAEHVRSRGGCPVCSSTIEIVERIYFTQATCVVCMDNPPKAVFKPCCHAVCCEDCSNTIVYGEELDIECKCPVCNAYIEELDLFRLAYS